MSGRPEDTGPWRPGPAAERGRDRRRPGAGSAPGGPGRPPRSRCPRTARYPRGPCRPGRGRRGPAGATAARSAPPRGPASAAASEFIPAVVASTTPGTHPMTTPSITPPPIGRGGRATAGQPAWARPTGRPRSGAGARPRRPRRLAKETSEPAGASCGGGHGGAGHGARSQGGGGQATAFRSWPRGSRAPWSLPPDRSGFDPSGPAGRAVRAGTGPAGPLPAGAPAARSFPSRSPSGEPAMDPLARNPPRRLRRGPPDLPVCPPSRRPQGRPVGRRGPAASRAHPAAAGPGGSAV